MRYSMSKGRTINICQQDTAVVAQGRNDIVDEAVKAGAEWILWIDSDMVFREDYLEMLLAHGKDVVGGLCVQRVPPFFSTVYFLDPRDDMFICLDSADPNAVTLNSLLRCDATGTAFLLTRTSVFEKLQKPYFSMPPSGWFNIVKWAQKVSADPANKSCLAELDKAISDNKNKPRITGEDLIFAKALYDSGIEVYVDTGALVGHVGHYPYTFIDRLSYIETHETTRKVDESGAGESQNRVRSYAGAGMSALLRSTRKAEAISPVTS
jgi:hypothetical protein